MIRASFFPLLLLAVPVAAQTGRPDTIAVAGGTGIYVWLGGTVVSGAHPVDGTVAHRVERRRAGSSSWSLVGDISAVRDARAFFAPLDSGTRAAIRAALQAASDNAAWDYIVRFPRADSLAALLGHEGIRLALGLYALDRQVSAGDRWEYRVSRLDAQGQASLPVVSTPVAFPAPLLTDSVHVLRATDREGGGVLWWRLDLRTRIRWVEIWRRRGTTGAFTLIDSVATFLRAGDSLLVGYRDAGLPAGTAFQYYALPRDFFFAPGTASDTVTAYTVDDRRLAVPESLQAAGDSTGVRLSWRLSTTGLARAVRVWRSTRQDSGWHHLAELPGDARRFTDDRVAPMTLYFYRLTVLGVRGQESPPTGAVFGFHRASRPPEPPSLVQVDTAGRALRISWTPNREPDIKGYYVYRSDAQIDTGAVDTSYAIVSPLVAAGESSYVDSGAARVPGRQWRFVVQAINSSDRSSGYSAPATAPAAASLAGLPPLPAVTGLRVFVRDALARVIWDGVSPATLTAAGYEVLRAAAPDTVLRPLATGTLGLGDNAAWDSTVAIGRRYRYAVRLLGADGTRGALSAPAEIDLFPAPPSPPANPRARATPDGIELTWGEISGVSGVVRVYRGSPGTAMSRIAEVPSDPGLYLDRSAQAGVRYFYQVTLVVDGVESARSVQASARR
jgi:hypothetical protein